MALEGGLITPIIRQAETKSLAQIAVEAKDLVDRERVIQAFIGDVFSRNGAIDPVPGPDELRFDGFRNVERAVGVDFDGLVEIFQDDLPRNRRKRNLPWSRSGRAARAARRAWCRWARREIPSVRR